MSPKSLLGAFNGTDAAVPDAVVAAVSRAAGNACRAVKTETMYSLHRRGGRWRRRSDGTWSRVGSPPPSARGAAASPRQGRAVAARDMVGFLSRPSSPDWDAASKALNSFKFSLAND